METNYIIHISTYYSYILINLYIFSAKYILKIWVYKNIKYYYTQHVLFFSRMIKKKKIILASKFLFWLPLMWLVWSTSDFLTMARRVAFRPLTRFNSTNNNKFSKMMCNILSLYCAHVLVITCIRCIIISEH
jgi:hypothetical protein